MSEITLSLSPIVELTREDFYRLCQQNPDLKLERDVSGKLIIMAPTGGETGRINSYINLQLGLWNEPTKLGEVFDSSTGFTLPNGAERSPDVSWIEKSRWDSLTRQQKEKFIPLCPDFVIEIMSPTDRPIVVREKMQEYISNGCRLGWSIDRQNQEVKIYRSNPEVDVLKSPLSLSGEDILPGFTLDTSRIWNI